MNSRDLESYLRKLAMGLLPSAVVWLAATAPPPRSASFDYHRVESGLGSPSERGYANISTSGSIVMKRHRLAGVDIPIPEGSAGNAVAPADRAVKPPEVPGLNLEIPPDIASDEPASPGRLRPEPPVIRGSED